MHLEKACESSMSYSCRENKFLPPFPFSSRHYHVTRKTVFARVCAIHQEAWGSKECPSVCKKVGVFTASSGQYGAGLARTYHLPPWIRIT